MIELKIETNLRIARFGITKSRLTLEDGPFCKKCSLGKHRKEDERPLFVSIPKPPKTAKTRLMVITNYAVGKDQSLAPQCKSLMLEALNGLKFDYIYTAPAVRCPHNKAPTKVMMSCCEELLKRDLMLIKPTVIMCIGKGPSTYFNVSGKITDLTSMVHTVAGIPGQDTWGYSPKLIITEDIEKVCGDVQLRTGFIGAFRKAERVADPRLSRDDGIKRYALFESPAEFREWVDALEDKLSKLDEPVVAACDIESTGLNPFASNARMRTIAFSMAIGKAFCVSTDDPSNKEEYFGLLRRLFSNPMIAWVYFNGKFDVKYKKYVHNIIVANLHADVIHMAYLLDPTKGAYGYKLKMLIQEYTNLGAYETELHEDEEKKESESGLTIWETTPVSVLAPYNCCDSDGTLRLYYIFKEKLIVEGMWHLVSLMIHGQRVLIDMESNGLLIDQHRVLEYKTMLKELVSRYEAECKELTGKSIDFSSPVQVEKLLYDDLGYPVQGRDGKRETGEDALLVIGTPLTKAILKYRRASKYLTTYINGYYNPEKLDLDGRLRGSFHQTGTRTGRLSSTEPNLQNLSKGVKKHDPAYEDMHSINLKSVIVAPPGWTLMQADLSQAEMRVATCGSKEPALITGYCASIDIHSLNAKGAFSIKKDLSNIVKAVADSGLVPNTKEYDLEVLKRELNVIKKENPEERNASKSISFGILYAMTARGLQYDLNMKTIGTRVWSLEECQSMMDNFHKTYPVLTRYLNAMKNFAIKTGYIKNLFGRKRWLPNINNRENWRLRGKDRNAAVNTPIQGGSADMMLCGMYDMWCRLDLTRAKPIITVHDSIVLEVRNDYLVEAAKITKHALENPTFMGKPLPFLCIPIVCDIEVGKRYGEMNEIDVPLDQWEPKFD